MCRSASLKLTYGVSAISLAATQLERVTLALAVIPAVDRPDDANNRHGEEHRRCTPEQ